MPLTKGNIKTATYCFIIIILYLKPEFWYHLGRGSKQAEPILKGGVKTLQTTDWSERIITRVVSSSAL